jgi:hypothetical protein
MSSSRPRGSSPTFNPDHVGHELLSAHARVRIPVPNGPRKQLGVDLEIEGLAAGAREATGSNLFAGRRQVLRRHAIHHLQSRGAAHQQEMRRKRLRVDRERYSRVCFQGADLR